MCGRFAFFAPEELLLQLFHLQPMAEPLPQRFNIAPSQHIAVITNERPQELAWHRWGLVPAWARDEKIGYRMFNARSETAAEKPSFRAAFQHRRCLIPASGFFEWQRAGSGRQPVFISLRDRPLFAFAGLWERRAGRDGSVLHTATILTTEANVFMARVHHRMPVILAPEAHDQWLRPADRDSHQSLLGPCAAESMRAWPVSTFVNRASNDTPEAVEPLPEGPAGHASRS